MTKVSVFQTIQTKYISPSHTLRTRIGAKSASGIRIIRGYNYGIDLDANHAAVAQELQAKLNWTGKRYGDLIGGQNADGSYTWIMQGTVKELPSVEYVCVVCGVDGPNHGHYSAKDPATHKFIAGEVK